MTLQKPEGRGADAAIDSVGGTDGEELACCTRAGGKVVSAGLLSGVPVHWGEVSRATDTAAQLFWLRHWIGQATVRRWHDTFEQLIGLVARRQLRLAGISGRYGLAQVKEAVLAADAPGRPGKILLMSEPEPLI